MTRRTDASRERADLVFLVYYQRGPGRSLDRLHGDLQTMGVRISLATLKRYSSRYGWRELIADLDAQAREQQDQRSIEHVLAMDERQIQLGRALQGAGGSALQRLIANDARLAALKPSDIVHLIEVGLKAERNAVGASSDRREIATETWNDVTRSIVPLFKEVNLEPDPSIRALRFAQGVDRLVDTRLAEVTERGE